MKFHFSIGRQVICILKNLLEREQPNFSVAKDVQDGAEGEEYWKIEVVMRGGQRYQPQENRSSSREDVHTDHMLLCSYT